MNSGIDIWTATKDIPILLVAEALNIEVNRNKAMCFTMHDKKSPSLSFSPDKNLWHCFGCGLGGTNIELVSSVLSIDSISAARWLDSKFIKSGFSNQKKQNHFYKPTAYSHLTLNPSDSQFTPDHEVYEYLLSISPLDNTGRRYLEETRGFTKESIDVFRIGQINNPQLIAKKLLDLWGLERLLNCGLFKTPEAHVNKFIWWDEVLLFPFLDSEDKIIYIQARRLNGNEPKYLNLSKIKKPLFNAQILKSLPSYSRVYICEGIPDTIAASQCGLNAVGILGANSFNPKWINLLKPFEIFVIPDADPAGWKMFTYIQQEFRKAGKSVEAVIVEKGKDFSDVFRTFK